MQVSSSTCSETPVVISLLASVLGNYCHSKKHPLASSFLGLLTARLPRKGTADFMLALKCQYPLTAQLLYNKITKKCNSKNITY